MALDFLADPYLELEFYTNSSNGIGVDGVFLDCPETGLRCFAAEQPEATSQSNKKSHSTR